MRRLVSSPDGDADALVDEQGAALDRLGVRESAVYLIRPDGYVAYRSEGTDLRGVEQWLANWGQTLGSDTEGV